MSIIWIRPINACVWLKITIFKETYSSNIEKISVFEFLQSYYTCILANYKNLITRFNSYLMIFQKIYYNIFKNITVERPIPS